MGVVFDYPITVHVDNVGDIFPSENTSVSQQAEPIGVHHYYMRDYVEDWIVKIIFYCS